MTEWRFCRTLVGHCQGVVKEKVLQSFLLIRGDSRKYPYLYHRQLFEVARARGVV